MSSDIWICKNIFVENYLELNKLVNNVSNLLKELKRTSHLETYFFNRYSNPQERKYFIKLGLVNADSTIEEKLDNLLTSLQVTKIEPYDCEMWEVGGMQIDKIKCISCEIAEIIRSNFEEKITIEQAFYILHFIMNQLDYSYQDEITLYQLLYENIKRQLESRE